MTSLSGVNIALRAVQEPALSALGDSPLGQEASDRIDEFTTRLMDEGPWWFQQATHYGTMSALAGNELLFMGGEVVTGTTNQATFNIICISKNRVWLKYIEGTIGTGAETYTGAESEATLTTTGTLTAIDPHTTWAFSILPEPFAQYIAQDVGLDLERQYKRGGMDEQVLTRTVQRAKVQAESFDSGWQGWRSDSQRDIASVKRAYNVGPESQDRLTDD